MKSIVRLVLAAAAGAVAAKAAFAAKFRDREARREPSTWRSNEELIRARYEAVNAHDWDRFEGFYADSVVWDDPALAEPVRGPAEVRKRLETFAAAFPDLRWRLDRIFGHDDLVCAEFTFTGTHQDELPGHREPFEATGEVLELRAVGVYQVAGGKIADSKVYFDLSRLRG